MSYFVPSAGFNPQRTCFDSEFRISSKHHMERLASCLETSDTLTSIILTSAGVDSPYTKRIGEALAVNSSLRSLDLSHNPITLGRISPFCDSKEGIVSLCSALSVNRSLTMLNLRCCSLDSAAIALLSETLKVNSTLRELELSRNEILSEVSSICNALTGNSSLRSLTLRCASLTMEAATEIFESLLLNSTLTKLNLGYNPLLGTGIERVAAAITSNTSLKELHLTSTGAMKNGNEEAIIEALKLNTTITSLDIGSNDLGNECVSAFAAYLAVNPPLKTLNLSTKICDTVQDIAGALITNTTLTSLTVCHNDLDDSHAPCLASCLSINTSLTSLDLRSHRFTIRSAGIITAHLNLNPSITWFDVENNFPTDLYNMDKFHLEESPLTKSIKPILARNVHNLSLKTITLFSMLFQLLKPTLQAEESPILY